MDNQKELEKLTGEYEKLRTEAKEKQDRAKEFKEEIIHIMNEMGYDEVILNGWDGMVKLEITYPEREVLNKKELAEAMAVTQKEINKPEVIIELTQSGKLTHDIIERYTIVEERMQFSIKELKEGDDELSD